MFNQALTLQYPHHLKHFANVGTIVSAKYVLVLTNNRSILFTPANIYIIGNFVSVIVSLLERTYTHAVIQHYNMVYFYFTPCIRWLLPSSMVPRAWSCIPTPRTTPWATSRGCSRTTGGSPQRPFNGAQYACQMVTHWPLGILPRVCLKYI
jgi:hypothetical protein